jgi:hypothetical protein
MAFSGITPGSISEYRSLMSQFCSLLDIHIGRVAANFRVQGPEMAASLCAATFDFGNSKAFLSECFRHQKDLKRHSSWLLKPLRPRATLCEVIAGVDVRTVSLTAASIRGCQVRRRLAVSTFHR